MRSPCLPLLPFALILSSLCAGCATPPPEPRTAAPPPAVLPLRVLRLYETGVGYFERAGSLGGGSGSTLPVPAGHLDDALATLVVLRAGGEAKVSGLTFASSVTKATARSSAGLPPDPTAPIAFQNLLESLRGARVTLVTREGREPVEGRVVEVALEADEAMARALAQNKDAKHEDPKHLVVTLLTPHGELTQVPAETILRVRPEDPTFAARLDTALDALGTRSIQNERALHLLGDAAGPVRFGYIAETPIWRATYRLVLDTEGTSGALQGWALVHNDTDEDWRDVRLELVNGEPDSFVFPMAAPRYARRTLVHPDEPLSTIPQLHDTTADALWGDNLNPGGAYGTGQGFGSGHGRLGGSHRTRAPSIRMGATSVSGETTGSSLLSVGNLAGLAPATGTEQGALFVYSVPAGLSLQAHASGLVPFVDHPLSIERLAFFPGPGAPGRTAVRFVNGTGQTLPAGTMSFFGDGGFLGETTLDRLKPGQRRFLEVGNDLDVEVAVKKVDTHEQPKQLVFEDDELSEHFLRTTDSAWTIENRSGAQRAFYVTITADRNATITGADRLDFDEATSSPIVIFDAKPKQKADRSIKVVEGLARGWRIDGLTDKRVRDLLTRKTLPNSTLETLRRALPQVQALEASIAASTAADTATQVAQEDLERLREDVKALGGGNASGGAATPLVKRMGDAEDQVARARQAKQTAERALDSRKEAVRAALRGLQPPEASPPAAR